MKKWISVLIFIVIIAGIFLVVRKNFFPENSSENNIKINNHKIKVEIRQDKAGREKGLSGRENLCTDCGMLFIFDREANYPFWMKEMSFNIDMLWISGTKVVKIAKDVSSAKGDKEVVDPQILSDKVLEINAGKSEEWGIKEGNEVILNLQ